MRFRRPWLLLAAACLVPAALDAFQTYVQGILGSRDASWRSLVWQASEWIILGALVPFIYWLARRFPLRRPWLGRSLLVHAGGAALLCATWAALGIALRWMLGIEWEQASRAQQLASWMLTTIPWGTFMYFTVLGCVLAFHYFVEAKDREAHAARLAAQVAEARLGALRMQLHPHFLFNSLNAIAVLVRDKDTAGAGRMLELLGDVLHQVLRAGGAHEVPLSDEIRFLERYLAIERVRFSDRLDVTFRIDAGLLDAAVPAFVLQPLVENALRHGVARRSDAGRVEIAARRENDDLVLSVRDDGPGIDAARDTQDSPGAGGRGDRGLGLANTRERLATLYGARARVDLGPAPGRGAIAVVRLPWRRFEDAKNASTPAFHPPVPGPDSGFPPA